MINLKFKIGFWISIFSAVFFLPESLAQTNPETLYLQTDRPLYHTGETIWYQVFFLNEQVDDLQSNILHVQFLGPAGQILFHQKLKRNNRSAAGEILLPKDLNSGNYRLRCYTNWNLNFAGYQNFERIIAVINLQKADKPNFQFTNFSDPGSKAKPELQIEVNSLESGYKKNQSVQLQIQSNDGEGKPIATTMCISIIDLDWFGDGALEASALSDYKNYHQSANRDFKFNPIHSAEKSLNLRGSMKYPDNSQPVTSNFLALHQLEGHQFVMGKAAKGQFNFQLTDFIGTQTFQLQNLNPLQTTSPQLEIQEMDHNELGQNELYPQVPWPDSVISRYADRAISSQKIASIFAVQENNTSAPSPDNSNQVLGFSNPDRVCRVADYENLSSLGEFIDEVILSANVSSNKGKLSLKLFNKQDRNHYPFPPWYFVDGYLYGDEAELLDLPLTNIDRIEIFSDRKTILDNIDRIFTGSGVIAIYSKGKSLLIGKKNKLNLLELQGLHPNKKFSSQASSKKSPHFPATVHWESQFQTDPDGKATLAFKTSDAVGRFLLLIDGISDDGKTGSTSIIYTVGF